MNKNQRYIREAFIHLIEKKSFHEISVRDITMSAEVSRSTFYNYYTDKYELLEEIEEELITGFICLMMGVRKKGAQYFFDCIQSENFPYYVEYFNYIQLHAKLFTPLLSAKSETNFSDRFMYKISATRSKTMDIWGVNSDDSLAIYRENLAAAAYVSLFTTWLNNDLQPSPEDMGKLLSSLWKPGIFYSIEVLEKAGLKK